MIDLPNGCKCSELAVSPKHFRTKNTSTKEPWHIHYRFYDAEGKVKQVSIRGMNHLSKWADRKELTERFLADELHDLLRGYNPFIKNREEVADEYEIDPLTPFVTALQKAFDRMKIPENTRANIKSMLKIAGGYLKQMSFYFTPIKDIKRRHIKQLLEKIEEGRGLSASNYNHYRAYFMMIFSELVSINTIEINPVDKELKKREEVKKIKITLEEDERRKVNQFLKARHYTFWRYMHIFFHSGSRTTELFRLQGKDVDLKRQRYKVTIKKRRKPVEVWKTIKDIALPLWEEVMEACNQDQYLFSRGLRPGAKPLNAERITKIWNKYIKHGVDENGQMFNITADFYSLKHLNTSEVVDLLSTEDAAKLNAHEGTAMVRNIYDVKAEDRQHERLKKINNKFA